MTRPPMHPLSKSETEGYQNTVVLLPTLIAYFVPLFYLWNKVDYPESLGLGSFDNGRAGVFESWWYSYKLLGRHHVWDLILFVYMWLGPALIGTWFVRWQATQKKASSQENDAATPDDRSANA